MGKRIFDLVLGTLLLLVALPLILVFAVALAVTLRAWPFFVQERIGQHGRPFRMFKLRTLPSGTPRYALKSTLGLESLPALPRMLRKSHLDELPQLFSVVAGTLSLVGPRPKMPDHCEPAPAEYVAVRQSIQQGCTGLWQIGRHADGLPHEAPEYDYFYLRNRTVRLDAWILWTTVRMTLGLTEGVDLESVPEWALVADSAPVPRLAGTPEPAAVVASAA